MIVLNLDFIKHLDQSTYSHEIDNHIEHSKFYRWLHVPSLRQLLYSSITKTNSTYFLCFTSAVQISKNDYCLNKFRSAKEYWSMLWLALTFFNWSVFLDEDTFMYLFLVANYSRQVSGLWPNFKEYLRNFSIFPSAPPLIDKYERRTQRISTILFILSFIASMAVILVYTLPLTITILNENTNMMVKTVTVSTPSLTQYSQLSSTFPQTLQCTCSQASINYAKFIYMEYSLHQVCSSVFVDQNWIDYLQRHSRTTILRNDFRSTGSSAFQALRVFCKLINQTISDGLVQFYSNQYVSTSLRPSLLMQSEIKSLIDQFRSSLSKKFSLSYSMIRDIIQANALFSGLGTNYHLDIVNNQNVSTVANTYNGCNCASSPTCVTQYSIYQYPSETSLFDIPGLYTGCYVTEALLQSSLECFYSQSCIDELQSYLIPASPVKMTALNSSLSSVYSMSSTIQQLVDNLMIEQWNPSLSYERYYDQCNPTQCTYTDIDDTFKLHKNIILNIVIILLAIIGGLNTVLRCVVPLLVRPIMFCFGKKRRNVIPVMSTVRT